MYICKYVWIYTYMHIYSYMYTYTYTHTYMYVCTCIFVHTYMYKYIYYTHMCFYIYFDMFIFIHIHIYICVIFVYRNKLAHVFIEHKYEYVCYTHIVTIHWYRTVLKVMLKWSFIECVSLIYVSCISVTLIYVSLICDTWSSTMCHISQKWSFIECVSLIYVCVTYIWVTLIYVSLICDTWSWCMCHIHMSDTDVCVTDMWHMQLNYVSHITKVELYTVCVTDICVCHWYVTHEVFHGHMEVHRVCIHWYRTVLKVM